MTAMFELAPWRSPLARAIHRNQSQAHQRFLQLATVTQEGKPKNRTVVFRGFVDQSNLLKIITDSRSEKISHLQQNAWAEIAWYFTKTREQFRLSGTISLITHDDLDHPFLLERKRTWQSLSDAARSQFLWSPPAQPRHIDDVNFQASAPDSQQPVKNFVLLLMNITEVDHLELRGNPQNRYLYRQTNDGGWTKMEVNP